MSDTHGKFIWAELMTPDKDEAGRFYSHVGLLFQRRWS